MNTIQLSSLCPQIFQHLQPIKSDVWNQEILFEKGNTYLIQALSGSGKSTLFSYMCGYRDDYSGRLSFDGKDVRNFTIENWTTIRRCQLSHLIQDLKLLPDLTVYENIDIKNCLTHYKSKTKIEEELERMGIAEKRDIPVGKLSFGQQQRVALIRALAQPFDFLLTDEPISHLDDHHAQLMSDYIGEEITRTGAGLITTSIGKHFSIPYNHIYHL